jgi:hypothetical protein
MKRLFLLFILIASFLVSPAQKKRNIYYLKDNGTKVAVKDSADFFRIIEEPDSGSNLYNMFEVYPSGEKKRTGKLSQFSPSVKFEGWFQKYT